MEFQSGKGNVHLVCRCGKRLDTLAPPRPRLYAGGDVYSVVVPRWASKAFVKEGQGGVRVLRKDRVQPRDPEGGFTRYRWRCGRCMRPRVLRADTLTLAYRRVVDQGRREIILGRDL